jgi:hypothetical protein
VRSANIERTDPICALREVRPVDLRTKLLEMKPENWAEVREELLAKLSEPKAAEVIVVATQKVS